jgi:hypothetical protein
MAAYERWYAGFKHNYPEMGLYESTRRWHEPPDFQAVL